ncbi:hypothetical protein HPP92_027803 [Vanilla planifolia]|uniref:Uncharacterized protein n=1 Tax=Vanilla planifolia TaxID=51239 RepID=A0A835U8X5_VANPL|nr:hypothetical protein HPP92_027803 [Vanilla planifolia]KAG0452305.1 hypothetical protein HPP92_024969 [Vanilla planifolia]
MAGNGKVEEEKEELKKGGLRTMPFVLASEIRDRFALAGFNANKVQYMQNELHLHLVQATNTLNFFSGTASLTPLLVLSSQTHSQVASGPSPPALSSTYL